MYPITAINAYAYAANNPMVYTDPTGRFLFLLVAGIVAGAFVANKVFNIEVEVIRKVIIGATIAAAAFFTGGLVAAAGSAAFGALGTTLGAVVGSFAGGVVAGGMFELTEIGTFNEGFAIGNIAGGIGGAFFVHNAGFFGMGGSVGREMSWAQLSIPPLKNFAQELALGASIIYPMNRFYTGEDWEFKISWGI